MFLTVYSLKMLSPLGEEIFKSTILKALMFTGFLYTFILWVHGFGNMIMLFQSSRGRAKGIFQEQSGDEYEITSEIVDAVTTQFSVNGEKVFTSYDMNVFILTSSKICQKHRLMSVHS